jgi:hypothetical protein
MKTVLTLLVFMTLCCAPKVMVIPDPNVPHQVAKETTVEVWMRLPDGRLASQEVRLLKGWWIAGPPVVESTTTK